MHQLSAVAPLPVRWLGGLIVGAALLLPAGESRAEQGGKPAAVPALYPTQAEAERAAKQHFHCTGAHRMGDQWMPCSQHGTQQHHH